MRYLLILFLFFSSLFVQAQYEFVHTKNIACTSIKNQANTGTCWSFATASFIESELMRRGFDDINLSEMYVVRNIYNDKAYNYILRQGKANFSQGSLAHDLIGAIAEHGVITEEAYSGLIKDEKAHNHSEMESGLKGFLDGVMKSRRLSSKWQAAFNGILDAYLGKVPGKFAYQGNSYTPDSFKEYLGINVDDYVNLSSFSHHPYYENFILEIPDNYSNGSYFNVPLEELMSLIDAAVEKGYTVAWDGDVSEKSFSSSEGIAILPLDPKRSDLFTQPGDELDVNQELRQQNFESYSTTDDHLMHIVGKAKDKNGTEYYIIKNSWGKTGPYNGYLYMSKPYVAMKTIAVMMHQDALSNKLRTMLTD